MKRSCAFFVFFLTLLGALISSSAAPPTGYYLVWGDEFNSASLDTNKWDYWLLGKWRDAVNTTNAVTMNGSNAVITTYTTSGTTYTAMLASQHHFHPRYGYYEASIKWADTNGMWSAFWLRSPTMGTYLDDAFVSGGELDIAEHRYIGIYGTNIADRVVCNVHWDGYGAAEQTAGSPNVGTGLSTGFHTYSLLWNTNTYKYSIDGSQVWDGSSLVPAFGSDTYVLLSSEVDDTSTTWAGTIPAAGYGSQATSKVKMTIDYFRYYAPTNVIFWTGATSAYWTNNANWVSNMPPLPASDLTFSRLSGQLNSSLGSDFSVHGLIFLNTSNTTSLNGTNVLTIGAGGIDAVAADHNVTLNSPIKLGANQRWTVGRTNPGDILLVNGATSGTGALTKAGWGTLILNGTNSFSGTLNIDTASGSTNDGAVVISQSAAVANVASPITIRNTSVAGSVLQLSNNVAVPQSISVAGRDINAPAIQSLVGSNILSGGLTLAGGGSNYIVQCDAGTLVLGSTISAGATATGARAITLKGQGTTIISGSIQNGRASSLSLVGLSAGTTTLTGANSLTGGTTNWQGTLIINGTLSGPLMFNGGTLGGTGTIDGPTTVGVAHLSPGDATSIGTLSFGSNLTLGSYGMTTIKLDASQSTNDQINVAGTFLMAGPLTVTNLAGTLSLGQTFKIFNAGTFSGSFSNISLPPLGAGLAWNTNNLATGTLAVATATHTLSINPQSDGSMQVNWYYGKLQMATDPAGPYVDVPGATTPYLITPTNQAQFFRFQE